MTRRRAGWTGALIAVPGAAAAFAGLVGWAVQHEPPPAAHPVTAPTSNVPAAADLTLSRALSRQDRELADLQRRLHALRGQLAELTRPAGATPGASATTPAAGTTVGSTGPASAPNPVSPSPRGSGSTTPAPGSNPAPAPVATSSVAVPAPPPASATPPPPTQTTTGASGTKK